VKHKEGMKMATFKLDDTGLMILGTELPMEVEVEADIDYSERWGFHGQTVGYDPYVAGVSFAATLGIGNADASKALEEYLMRRYNGDEAFRLKINTLAMRAHKEECASAQISMADAGGDI
jgi:hypothetical protein